MCRINLNVSEKGVVCYWIRSWMSKCFHWDSEIWVWIFISPRKVNLKLFCSCISIQFVSKSFLCVSQRERLGYLIFQSQESTHLYCCPGDKKAFSLSFTVKVFHLVYHMLSISNIDNVNELEQEKKFSQQQAWHE